MTDKLTPKQEGFVKDYLETKNGTEAAIKNYDTDRVTAASIAWENLRKPQIIQALQDASSIAKDSIIDLAQGAKNENVRLQASKDILDRTGFNIQKDSDKPPMIIPVLVQFIKNDDKGTDNNKNTD